MSSLPVNVLTALVSFDRIFELLDLKPLIAERPAACPLPSAASAPVVEFEHVSFRYPAASEVSLPSLESIALPGPEHDAGAWVLRDVSFRVPAGKLTAWWGLRARERRSSPIWCRGYTTRHQGQCGSAGTMSAT